MVSVVVSDGRLEAFHKTIPSRNLTEPQVLARDTRETVRAYGGAESGIACGSRLYRDQYLHV